MAREPQRTAHPNLSRASHEPVEPQRDLPEITALLADRLPLNEKEIGHLLVSDGLALSPPPLADLSRLFRSRGRKVPFRIVRCGSMEIIVGVEGHRLAAAVGSAAVRMVQHWGLVSVEAVAARAEALSGLVVSAEAARRVIRALPLAVWLDGPDRSWFSFLGRSSGLEGAIDKVFNVAPRIDLDELRAALAKGLPAVDAAPRDVLECYLVEVAGCSVAGRNVCRSRPAAGLSPGEATLVDLLNAAGGELELSTLRRRAEATGLPETTLGRLLKLSPLVLPSGRERVRLAGRTPHTLAS